MKVRFGFNAADRANGEPVEWDSDRTINPHAIVLGDSGSGKTHLLRRMMSSMVATGGGGVRLHVMDGHGDITVPGESVVRFSGTTDFGLNPLVVDPDPDFGGVQERIQNFISTINRTSTKLGSKQVYALRNLLFDLYSLHGFRQDDPSSWIVDAAMEATHNGRLYLEVPFEEKDLAKEAGAQFDRDAKAWWISEDQHTGRLLRWSAKQSGKRFPTLLDVVRFAKKKQTAMFFGSNTPTMHLLEDVNRLSRQLQAKQLAALRRGESAPDADKLEKDIQSLKAKSIESFSEYVSGIRSGRELEDLLKYDSKDVLQSVIERLDNLLGTGLFRSTPAPYHPRAAIWRRDISKLGASAKRMFVDFELEALFRQAVQQGITDKIRDVVILDEADLYTTDDPDHIINRIIKEARKFGLALVMASQAPTHFSENMLAGVAVRVIIGMDKVYSSVAVRKLGIDEASLNFIVPWRRCVVQLKNKGEKGSRCHWVNLPGAAESGHGVAGRAARASTVDVGH